MAEDISAERRRKRQSGGGTVGTGLGSAAGAALANQTAGGAAVAAPNVLAINGLPPVSATPGLFAANPWLGPAAVVASGPLWAPTAAQIGKKFAQSVGLGDSNPTLPTFEQDPEFQKKVGSQLSRLSPKELLPDQQMALAKALNDRGVLNFFGHGVQGEDGMKASQGAGAAIKGITNMPVHSRFIDDALSGEDEQKMAMAQSLLNRQINMEDLATGDPFNLLQKYEFAPKWGHDKGIKPGVAGIKQLMKIQEAVRGGMRDAGIDPDTFFSEPQAAPVEEDSAPQQPQPQTQSRQPRDRGRRRRPKLRPARPTPVGPAAPPAIEPPPPKTISDFANAYIELMRRNSGFDPISPVSSRL